MDADEVEAVLSDVLVEVWEHLPEYEERGFPISAWIWRICHTRTLDHQRRVARERRRMAGDERLLLTTPDAHDFTEAVALAEELAPLWARVEALPPRWRAVLALRFGADMSLADIAAREQTTVGAIKALQHRALEHLRLGRDLSSHTRDQ